PSRLLVAEKRLYAYDPIDNTVSISDVDNCEALEQLVIPGRRGESKEVGGYTCYGGEKMALSDAGATLYLYTPDWAFVRLDLDTLNTTQLDLRHARGLATDAAGRVWAVTQDGVRAMDSPNAVRYAYGFRHKPRGGLFVNADGDHPLVLI